MQRVRFAWLALLVLLGTTGCQTLDRFWTEWQSMRRQLTQIAPTGQAVMATARAAATELAPTAQAAAAQLATAKAMMSQMAPTVEAVATQVLPTAQAVMTQLPTWLTGTAPTPFPPRPVPLPEGAEPIAHPENTLWIYLLPQATVDQTARLYRQQFRQQGFKVLKKVNLGTQVLFHVKDNQGYRWQIAIGARPGGGVDIIIQALP